MQYLLDTCVISDFIKGEPGTQSRITQTAPINIAVSSITVMELNYGLTLNPQRAEKIKPIILSFLSSVTILPFTIAEAEKAAEIRAVLKSQGSIPIWQVGSLNGAETLAIALLEVMLCPKRDDPNLKDSQLGLMMS